MTPLPSDAQHRIDQHLDAIDAVLASTGMTRAERTAVVDDVQGQIVEMLASRVRGAPNVADVEAILAELDPPEAYKGPPSIPLAGVTGSPPAAQRLSIMAVVGAWAGLLALALFVLVWWLVTSRSDRSITQLPYATLLMLLPPATIPVLCGLVALSQIRHSGGRLYGLGLALLNVLLLPALILDWVLIALTDSVMTNWIKMDSQTYPGLMFVYWLLVVMIIVGIDFWIAKTLWRKASTGLASAQPRTA